MEVYILAIVGQELDHFKILDLEPSAKSRVKNIKIDKFIEVIKSGVSIPNVKIKYDEVYYMDRPISEVGY